MINKNDVFILRELGKELTEVAAQPEQQIKKEKWRQHTSLKGNTPMIFVHPDGAWRELLPPNSLLCESDYAKEIEYQLRYRLIRSKYLPDDVPVENELQIKKVIHNSWWGVEPKRVQSSSSTGAWHYLPIIETPSDWKKLSMPMLTLDQAETQKRFDAANEALGNILPITLIGETNFSFHMMHWYCDFRGLENMMTDLIEEPEMVHDTIRFFTEGVKSMLKQYEKYNLISLNNNNTFHYTGGIGYTNDLPSKDFDPNKVRLIDVWGAAEAQEFSSVSPSMHEEFILAYEREILELFGLNGYGCCDDLGKKLDNVLKIKNLRRVAICPWADISDFTPRLKKEYIMTWKPQPAFLAFDEMNIQGIKEELESGITKANGGILELVLRDTHTCRNQPERFTKWIKLARAAIVQRWKNV